jgi:platelet-activating factor acetylhydrolase
MPLLSSKLPKASGKFDVGTIDIEAPCEKRRIGNVVFKDTGAPAFELETVLFSLYYPSVKDAPLRAPNHPWVPKPISLTGQGYARFVKMSNWFTDNAFTFGLWMLAGSTIVPANVDVPLHGTVKNYRDYEAEHPLDDYGLPEFPSIVFSHGMASSRMQYSQYCSELASRGYIVAAIEHRDGSGPGTTIMTPNESKNLFHFEAEDIEPSPDTPKFKELQLAFRQAEVEETARVLHMLNEGRGAEVFRNNPRNEGHELAEWRGRLNTKRMLVGGHSYGATLALQALKGAPSEALPFVGGIILDPGKQSGPLNDDIAVPIVVVHSQSWSAKHSIFHGRPHFSVVKDLVRKVIDEKKKHAWFVTAKGTTHPSVTDAPLIEPFLLAWTTGATIDARDGVLQYVKIADQFMHYFEDGHRKTILKEEITHPEYDESSRPFEGKIAKYWQIHMAPSTACPAPGYCGLDDTD